MKIAKLHNNILVCILEIIKNATSLVHPSIANFQHLKVLESMIPKEKRNITTLNWSKGQLFAAATQHLTPPVVKYKIWKKCEPLEAIITTKFNENCRLGLIESYIGEELKDVL
jgi:hypothetical protein